MSSPILLYDECCNICSNIAKITKKISKSYIIPVGLGSSEGKKIKADFFGLDVNNVDNMFWLIKENTGYGGRNGVFPLIYETVKGLLK